MGGLELSSVLYSPLTLLATLEVPRVQRPYNWAGGIIWLEFLHIREWARFMEIGMCISMGIETMPRPTILAMRALFRCHLTGLPGESETKISGRAVKQTLYSTKFAYQTEQEVQIGLPLNTVP